LIAVEFWYNASFHSAPGRSPLEALYGWQPRLLGIGPQAAAKGKLEDWLAERANMNELIRLHLMHAEDHMKKQVDKHSTYHAFAIGDRVYTKF
jgi:hypothetical protein